MFKKLIVYLTLKCHDYLYKHNIELYKTPDQEIETNILITQLNIKHNELVDARLQIIHKFNELFTSIEDTYLTLLAKQKDQTLTTSMTESWFKRSDELNEKFIQQNAIMVNIQNLNNNIQTLKLR